MHNDMNSGIVRNAKMVNEGRIVEGDLRVKNGRIDRIAGEIDEFQGWEIDAGGKFLIPGIIDDQVHFREPGLTHKAEIATESRAAVAGGVTSWMDMPNVKPASLTQELLEERYRRAAKVSACNYSFYMGASNDNYNEVLKTDPLKVCGIKIFMGSSTGNMLVDDRKVLERLYANAPTLVAIHAEDEDTVTKNTDRFRAIYGDEIPFNMHPDIRSTEACYRSSSFAVDLARKHGTRLHILHISTARELELFDGSVELADKMITAEVCVHHLFFNASDYIRLGAGIKCNPAIKGPEHQEALLKGLLDNRLDIIATDHAPHTVQEKAGNYMSAPSGLPLVQHSLAMMLSFYHRKLISMERIVEKMCHAPQQCFNVVERGYLREGWWADLALVDPDHKWVVRKKDLLYKCGWSPLEGMQMIGGVSHTVVNGVQMYSEEKVVNGTPGMRLEFTSQADGH